MIVVSIKNDRSIIFCKLFFAFPSFFRFLHQLKIILSFSLYISLTIFRLFYVTLPIRFCTLFTQPSCRGLFWLKTMDFRKILFWDFWCIVKESLITKSIYKFGLSGCLSLWLFVCLYPINVKTAEPIGPKFCVGPHVTRGKVYEWLEFQKFVFKSFLNCKILIKRKKIYLNPQTFYFFFFQAYFK